MRQEEEEKNKNWIVFLSQFKFFPCFGIECFPGKLEKTS